MEIAFSKYHGAGNDFIMIDGRSQKFDLNNYKLIKNLCHRRFGIGADGLMILDSDSQHDFKMVYFNSDGYPGTMCGNGGRCICAFASSLGIINKKTTFIASDGIHEAFFTEDIINLKMNDVTEIKKYDDGLLINTGSPHFIQFEKNPHSINVEEMGKAIRHQERFSPNGTNVNFVSLINNTIHISTFERGVEAETLSCGTGSVAAAIAFSVDKPDSKYNYKIQAKGGELTVSFEKYEQTYHNIWLSGPAVKTFDGYFDSENLTFN